MTSAASPHLPREIAFDRNALGERAAGHSQKPATYCHLMPYVAAKPSGSLQSITSLCPFEGVPASLSPGLRTVNGAVRSLGETLSPGAVCPMNSGAGREPTGRSKSRHHRRPRLLDDPAAREPHLAADDDGVGAAADLPAAERRVAALGAKLASGSIVQRTSGSMIVTSASAPALERPLGNPQQLGRVDRQLADRLGPGQVARLDQARDRDRDQGLQADDAERGLVDLAHLLLASVGAWSVAMISIVPSLSPPITASTSLQVRKGGFIL